MNVLVVDASALLALLFDEEHAAWVAAVMAEHDGPLQMSTVNLAEVLIRAEDRARGGMSRALELIAASAIELVAPDLHQARSAAEARLKWPLNLGDCFAYALARASDGAILALDRDFVRADRPVLAP